MANISIPIYNVQIDDEQIGMTAISFVDEPAIMTDFVAFKKDAAKQMIWFSSHDKREVVSPILIPNQLIYRETKEGEPYYIRWTEEAIHMAAAKYLANGFWNNFTVLHPLFYDSNLSYNDVLEKDVYLLRMWIIEDSKSDDANTKYGFNLPKGTLMVHLKVHNRQIWKRIKSGELRGLSIEAFTNVIRDNNDLKLDINMRKLDVTEKQLSLFQKFISFMNEVSADAKDIADVAKVDETNSGEVSLKYYLDEDHYMEVDSEGFVRDEEYNLVAEGEYKLADGNVIVVDANNKFVETKAVSEETSEEPIEAPIAESKVNDDEKDEENDKENEGETDGEGSDVESEGKSVGDKESDEDDEGKKRVAGASVEDEEEKKEEDEAPVDEPIDEVPVEEVPSEEPPLALVPFEIDGVEFMLPQEVVDYINSLIGEKDSAINEIALMKENIPSASPIPTVINQGIEDEKDSLYNAIRLLNYKK